MRVRNVEKYYYLVVVAKYWYEYHEKAFVDRVCATLEEARYERESLEKNDEMSFLIIKGGKVIE